MAAVAGIVHHSADAADGEVSSCFSINYVARRKSTDWIANAASATRQPVGNEIPDAAPAPLYTRSGVPYERASHFLPSILFVKTLGR